MLTFLRRHQKVLFIVVSVMTIASFSFFGTFSTFDSVDRRGDRPVGKAVDGSPIKERELQAMIRFLSSDSLVLQNDLMATGLGALLAERYFDQIQSDFAIRLEKAKTYRPYVHPQAPFISAEEVWNRFMPQMARHLSDFRQETSSPKSFALFSRLFLDQALFTSDILARILAYQQKQYDWVQPDPSLQPERVALFGYRTAEDWFGPKFMEIAAEFVINAAIVAEEKGYQISTDEARAGLLQNSLEMLQARPSQKEFTYADAAEFLRSRLMMSGIDESSAIKVWKKVLLFRRLFNDVGTGMVVDPLSYEKFSAYACDGATIETYRLPEALRFSDLRSAFKFQLYLDAIQGKGRHDIAKLFSQGVSVQEVEKRCPELVQSRFHLEVAKVTMAELAAKISLKETWDFEKSDDGFALLKKEFPILGLADPQTPEERMQALDKIDQSLRFKIDERARFIIVGRHPEQRQEALSSSQPEKLWVGLRAKGSVAPFSDIADSGALASLLQEAPTEEPKLYASPNQETFYQVTVLEKPARKEVMTFQEALADDLFDQLLDARLSEAYPDIRKKDPSVFQTQEGKWRPFEEVKTEVGLFYFADAFKKSESQTAEEAALHRLSKYMAAALASLQTMQDESPYLKKEGDPLKDQWAIVKTTVDVQRCESALQAQAFSLQEGEWSSLQVPPTGDISFFRLVKRGAKGSEPAKIAEQMAEGQKILSMDAKRLLMHQILQRIERS